MILPLKFFKNRTGIPGSQFSTATQWNLKGLILFFPPDLN